VQPRKGNWLLAHSIVATSTQEIVTADDKLEIRVCAGRRKFFKKRKLPNSKCYILLCESWTIFQLPVALVSCLLKPQRCTPRASAHRISLLVVSFNQRAVDKNFYEFFARIEFSFLKSSIQHMRSLSAYSSSC
jgi:hypothetical protein